MKALGCSLDAQIGELRVHTRDAARNLANRMGGSYGTRRRAVWLWQSLVGPMTKLWLTVDRTIRNLS